MPSKYLNDARTGELIQKIYTADRAIATECKGYTDTEITSSATSLTATITALIDTKCAQAKLDAHPVGSFYESTDSTSPATLFGGTWQEQIPDGELVGAVMAYPGNGTAPDGWVLCDGSAINRTTYSALFAVIGTAYGTGDGSSTFNLPDMSNKFIQGNATAGTVKAAGLPNITGRINPAIPNSLNGIGIAASFSEASGAFATVNGPGTRSYFTSAGTTSKSDFRWTADFDASRSSSIYGASTTVQPPAVTMRYLIYTGVTSKRKWLRTA